MKWFWDKCAPDKAIRKQPTASPLQASIEQLRGHTVYGFETVV